MNNNLYGRGYMNAYPNNYYQQSMYEQIDNQIAQLNTMKEQMKNNATQGQHQQPSINQTFQLAPNGAGGIKYVNSIDEVNKETVFVDTPFFSKDLSVLWIKNSSGDIKAYELNEIVKKDEKDLQIEFLTAKVNELEGMITNEQPITNVINEQDTTSSTGDDKTIGTESKSTKSSSISKVSRSKKEQ